ncbi:hypothetical protein HDV06_002746 [Boothiomyces sp. JEL0866]|nr:hypothetical protein HDV06_002746 [Boothiomyces sp. JEL0866]
MLKYSRDCPMCKVSRVYHNLLLEKQLKNQMVKCGNEGCKRQLFQWSKDEHQSECPYTKASCPCCGEEITMKSMNNHLKTGCKILWVEHAGDTCSAGLQGHFRLNRDGYKFDIQDIKKSFAVIWHRVTTLVERRESDWQIRVFSHNDSTDDVDVNYWFPKETNSYDRKIKLSIKPLLKINEKNANFPRIPFEAEEVNFEPPQPKEGALEDFLHRLMDEEGDREG